MKQIIILWTAFCLAVATSSTFEICLVEQQGFMAKENITLPEESVAERLNTTLQASKSTWAAKPVTLREFSSMIRAGRAGCGAVLAVGDCAFCGLLQSWADSLPLPFAGVGPGSCPPPPRQPPGAASPSKSALEALADVVISLQWRELFFIFDDTLDDDIITNFVIELSNEYIGTILRKIEASGNRTRQIQERLDFVERFPANNIVLYLHEELVYPVFAEAKRLGLLTGAYGWLVWTEGLTWERLAVDFSNLLFLAPRRHSASCSLEPAGSAVLSSASSSTAWSPPLDCQADSDCGSPTSGQLFQARLERAMQTLTGESGQSGRGSQAEGGASSEEEEDVELDVCRVAWRRRRGGLQSRRVASWTSRSRLQLLDRPLFRPGFLDVTETTIKVTMVPLPPFVNKHIVNDSIIYGGFCIEILDELARNMKFRYVVVEPEDKKYGGMDNGEWNGMVALVMKGEVTLGVGPFSVTPERDTVVDFTKTLMEDGVGILTRQPDSQEVDVFKIFAPFDVQVWLGLLGATLATTLVLYLVNRLSPFALASPPPGGPGGSSPATGVLSSSSSSPDPRRLSTNLWLVFSSFVEQGGDPHPRSVSGRCVLGFWWLFTILMASTYTANLVAFLTVTIARKPINSLTELVAQTEIKPLVLAGTNLETLLRDAPEGIYKAAWDLRDPDLEVTTVEDALPYVLTGRYAFMADSGVLQNIVLNDCKTYALGDQIFNTVGIAFLMAENAPFKDAINENVLKMQEAGLVGHWQRKWWPKSDECSGSQRSSHAHVLGLSSLGGPFLLQAAVTLAAAAAALVLRAWAAVRASRRGDSGRGDGTGGDIKIDDIAVVGRDKEENADGDRNKATFTDGNESGGK